MGSIIWPLVPFLCFVCNTNYAFKNECLGPSLRDWFKVKMAKTLTCLKPWPSWWCCVLMLGKDHDLDLDHLYLFLGWMGQNQNDYFSKSGLSYECFGWLLPKRQILISFNESYAFEVIVWGLASIVSSIFLLALTSSAA